jgi:hypothetical protein
MKANLKKFIGMAGLGLALSFTGSPARAGLVQLPEVQVGTDQASGSMVGARYSGDSQQHITCIAHNPAVTCSARDKTGKYFVCNKIDWKWAAAVRAITDSSRIYFSSDPNTGSCTYLQVDNFSYQLR